MATTGTTIDTLQVNITANAQSATASLKSLASALQKVRTALTGMKDGVSVSDHLSKSLNEMNGSLNSITTGSIKKLQKLANALDGYANAVKKVGGIRGGKGITSKIAEAMKIKDDTAISPGGSGKSDDGDNVEEKGGKIIKVWTKISEAFGKAREALKGFIHRHTQLLRTFGRIALYRMIRSAIKAISEAFSEGLKNAYGFSKTSESFTRLAETLDRSKSITSQMINQIGAFWGEVKQFMLPAIEWIVDKVRFLFEYLTELFAALNGQKTYLRATYEAKEWDEAIGKAKEYKHQLLGIDEINNLSAQKAGGSKADDTDYSKLYEEVAVSKKLKKLADGIKEFGFKIYDVLFDWSDLTWEKIEQKFIDSLGMIAGAAIGFSIGGVPGAVVGALVGAAIQFGFSKLLPFEGKKRGKAKWYDALLPGLLGLAGGLAGAKLASALHFTKGKGSAILVGITIGAAVGFIMNSMLESTFGKVYDEQGLYALLEPALYGIAGGVLGFKYGGVGGALVGLSIGVAVGFVMKGMEEASITEKLGGEEVVQLLKMGLMGLTGFWIGFKYFGAQGALVGASIGVAVAFLLRLFDKAGSGNQIGALDIIEGVAETLAPLTGAYIGFKIGGVKGGLIGLVIGVSLSFVIEKFGKMENVAKSEVASNIMKTVATAVGADDVVEQIDLTRNQIANEGKGAISTVLRSDSGTSVSSDPTFLSNDWFIEKFQDAFDARVERLQSGKKSKVAEFFGDLFHINDNSVRGAVQFKASGGIPASGSMFIAGESGAEFVGNIGSTSAVANTGQMTDAIYKAAYMGMSKALKENGGGNMSGWEASTTDEIFAVMRKKASNYNKRTGNPAFA